jgi:hypothetical protein
MSVNIKRAHSLILGSTFGLFLCYLIICMIARHLVYNGVLPPFYGYALFFMLGLQAGLWLMHVVYLRNKKNFN